MSAAIIYQTQAHVSNAVKKLEDAESILKAADILSLSQHYVIGSLIRDARERLDAALSQCKQALTKMDPDPEP